MFQKAQDLFGTEGSMVDPFGGFGIFDDKGEVKRLVGSVIQRLDPEAAIESMRKIDFSYIFTLSKGERTGEVELLRTEIDASWDWRKGNIDPILWKKIEDTIADL